MKKDLLAGAFLAVCLVCTSGCMLRPSVRVAETSSTVIQAAAAGQPDVMYHIAGLGVIVIGAAVWVCGTLKAAMPLFASGVGIVAVGLIVQHQPWMPCAALIITGGGALLAALDRRREARKLTKTEERLEQTEQRLETEHGALGALVRAVEKAPGGQDVKDVLAADPEVKNLVRSVVTPIKQSLHEGE